MGVTSRRGGRIFSESRQQQMKNEAFERLFKRYYNEAKLYLTALCRNEALAEDIVSESFVKAFALIDEEKESFKFWLLKVCRNAYFDYLKKAKRLSPAYDNMRSDEADLAEKVIEDEEYRALYRAIALLKDTQDGASLNLLGVAHYKNGDKRQAEQAFRRAAAAGYPGAEQNAEGVRLALEMLGE